MSTSPNAEPSAAPQGPTRYFAGYRILLGLAVSALGAFALHWTHDPELSAFAIVTSVAGAVVSVWGYVATLISPKASREDVTWASLFFAVIVSLTAGNIYFNREDYGLPLAGIELAIAGGCFMVARTVAFVYSWIVKSWVKEVDWKRRRNAMILCAGMLVVVYFPVRAPLMTLLHLDYFGRVTTRLEPEHSAAALRNTPQFLLRWAVSLCLDSANEDLRSRTIRRAQYMKEIAQAIPTAALSNIVLSDTIDEETRRFTLRLVLNRSRETAINVARVLVRRPLAEDLGLLDKDCLELVIKDLSLEEFDFIWKRRTHEQQRSRFVRAAFYVRREDLIFKSLRLIQSGAPMQDLMKLIAGIEVVRNEDSDVSHESANTRLMGMLITSLKPEIRAGLFSYWAPQKGEFVYDAHWKTLPHTTRRLFSIALTDPEVRVQRAAVEKFIACVDNPEALPITRADLATDDGVRAAATKLLPKLEEARPE